MGPRHTYRPWQVASGLDRNVDRGRPLAQPDIVSRPNRLATNEAGITRAVRLPADTHTAPANEIVGEAFDVGVGHHTPILDLRLNELNGAKPRVGFAEFLGINTQRVSGLEKIGVAPGNTQPQHEILFGDMRHGIPGEHDSAGPQRNPEHAARRRRHDVALSNLLLDH